MPIGKLKSELIDKKDHFAITVLKKDREKYGITYESILFLEVSGKKFFRVPNKDFQISIPKRFLSECKGIISINIVDIYNKSLVSKRDKALFVNDCMNLCAFIPKETIFGKEIFVFDCGNWLYVWYSIGGGVEPVRIRKLINAEKLAELVGFFFGDGNTSKTVRSFRLNNCEASALSYCIKILSNLGISKHFLKFQIIYNSNKEIETKIKNRCIRYWSSTLKIKKTQIVSVNRSKGKFESLNYGSARIFFDSSVFVEILLHGVLKNIIDIVKKPKNKTEKSILQGFVRGLAAAEGSVYLRKGVLNRISLSFNQKTDDLEFYKKLLTNLGVTYGKHKRNELYIYGAKNFTILNELDIFKMHKKRKQKFLMGYTNHKFLQ